MTNKEFKMMKQSTRTRLHVQEFKKNLGRLLYECRLQKGLRLSQVARGFEWDLPLLEKMEMGKIDMKHFWKIIRLMCLYGFKLRLDTQIHIPPKNGFCIETGEKADF